MFLAEVNSIEAVSAVKALSIANQQGIPIYTITSENITSVLPQLALDSAVISEIQNALNAGKEVTISRTDISYNSFTGVGYIVIDPTTGEGAYMISGGESGGAFWPCAEYAFWHTAYVLAVATEYVGLAAGAALAALTIGPVVAAFASAAAELVTAIGALASEASLWASITGSYLIGILSDSSATYAFLLLISESFAFCYFAAPTTSLPNEPDAVTDLCTVLAVTLSLMFSAFGAMR